MEDETKGPELMGELELAELEGQSETKPADFSVASDGDYIGAERRDPHSRRTFADRRAFLRFGKKKRERRNGHDRRRGSLSLMDMV